jgi:hypothetical protein
MTLPVEYAGNYHTADEKTKKGNVSTYRQLQRTAESMAAGSAVCQASSKHRNQAPQKGNQAS